MRVKHVLWVILSVLYIWIGYSYVFKVPWYKNEYSNEHVFITILCTLWIMATFIGVIILLMSYMDEIEEFLDAKLF